MIDDQAVCQCPNTIDKEQVVLLNGVEVTGSQKLLELCEVIVDKCDVFGLVDCVRSCKNETQIGEGRKTKYISSVVQVDAFGYEILDVFENVFCEKYRWPLKSYTLVLTAVLKHRIEISELISYVCKCHIFEVFDVL